LRIVANLLFSEWSAEIKSEDAVKLTMDFSC